MSQDVLYENQRQKHLFLAKIFYEQTDENHPLSVYDLMEILEKYGISGNRKTIARDVEELTAFGMDIITVKTGKMNSYYLGSRLFEITELKLLADSVSSARFITEKKSRALLKKIESLAGIHEGREIKRNVFVSNRIKSDNECIYLNVDTISRAISMKAPVQFRYFDYDINKHKKFREGVRKCSPYALTWNDGNYYMISFYEKYPDSLSNFRVDRMRDVAILDEKRTEIPEEFDLPGYMNTSFSMFSSETEYVKIRFADHLVNPVIDRFGTDVILIPDGSGSFTVNVRIKPGAPFYGWLFQFGEEAEILEPPYIREHFSEMISGVSKKYSDQ